MEESPKISDYNEKIKQFKTFKKNKLKNLLELKRIILIDKLKNKNSLNHLTYTIDYAKRLIDEGLNNHKYLLKCNSNTQNDYQEYANYCLEFDKLTNELLNDIKTRPSNSALLVSLIEIEDKEKRLRGSVQKPKTR